MAHQLFSVHPLGYTYNQDEFKNICKEIAEASCTLRNKLEELSEMLNDFDITTQNITLSDEEEYNQYDIQDFADNVNNIETLFFKED